MPKTYMNYESKRKGSQNINSQTKGPVNSHVPSTDLDNGHAFHNCCTRRGTPAGLQIGTGTQGEVNGYFNHERKVKSTKAGQQKAPRKQGIKNSAVNDASASGRVISAGVSGGVSVNEHTSPTSCNPSQVTPKLNCQAPAKNQSPRKRFRYKKREVRTPAVPQEEEDWEKEIQEVKMAEWEDLCFGICPYGPEDLLQFSLRDLNLKQRDTVDLPVTANYRPSIHHPRPVKWSCYNIPTEKHQFEDVGDEFLLHRIFGLFLIFLEINGGSVQRGRSADAAAARLQVAFSMVSPTMKALVDAVWAVWSIGASIYDYIHTNAMEERIHALENVITIHQFVIALLSAGIFMLLTFILFKKL